MRWSHRIAYAKRCWLRQRRNSLLTTVTFTLVALLLSVGLSWIYGLNNGLRSSNRAMLGEHRIVTKDHHRLRAFSPLAENLNLEPLMPLLPEHCEPRIVFPAELRGSTEREKAMLYGLSKGQWAHSLSSAQHTGLVLGEGLAYKLKIKAGDRLELLTETQDQLPSAAGLIIEAVLRLNNAQLNNSAFISLELAQELTELPSAATEILCFSSPAPLKQLQQASTSMQSDGQPSTLLQLKLSQQEPYASTLRVAWVMNGIFISLLLGMAGIVLLNLCLIQRIGRNREVGVLKAIGARTSEVLMMALLEVQCSALLGSSLGSVLGILISTQMGQAGVDLGELSTQINGSLAVQTIIYPSWQAWMLLPTIAGSCLLALIAAIIPATISARTEPAKAMHRKR